MTSHRASPPATVEPLDGRSDEPGHEHVRRGERGAVMVLGALVMMLLLFFAAAAVDAGSWYSAAGRIQRATDNAALAAVAEVVRARGAGATEADAQASARALALSVLRDNGYDTETAQVAATVSFSKTATGGDKAQVSLRDPDLPLFFARLLTDNVSVSRTSEAVMSDCQSRCDFTIPLSSGLSGFVDAGTGGDGFLPALVGDKVFNLFHHSSGRVLACTDVVLEIACPGFPTEPYPGIMTNYVPTLAAVNEAAYFVVQTASSVGLGCWDATTLRACAGFATPRPLAPYKANGDKNGVARIVGPEQVGNRLYLYGDDNRMYCFDVVSSGFCPGYPKSSGLASSRNFRQRTSGTYVDGVVVQEVQADIQADGTGRLYTVGTPVDGASWLSCWDATTDAPCTGWTNVSTSVGRVFLFISYDTAGAPNGVCARGGAKGASGDGFECFDRSGRSRGTAGITIAFGGSGQQDAMAVASNGNTRTFFPQRGANRADCWDWSTQSTCAVSPSNWSGMKTADYGYVWDGYRCLYGLGHAGLLWAFDVDTGQYPCEAGTTGHGVIEPCTCADGVTPRWTTIRVTKGTDLSLFESFVVTLSLPDGSVVLSRDLAATGDLEIDLSFLNALPSPPASLRVAITSEVRAGAQAAVSAGSPGVYVVGGVRPTLVR